MIHFPVIVIARKAKPDEAIYLKDRSPRPFHGLAMTPLGKCRTGKGLLKAIERQTGVKLL